MGRPSSLPILSISKAALNMAMKTIALRLKDDGVTVILMTQALLIPEHSDRHLDYHLKRQKRQLILTTKVIQQSRQKRVLSE